MFHFITNYFYVHFYFYNGRRSPYSYPLRRKQSIHKIPVLIQIVVCLLLFILGLSIGTNKLIIGNLSYFCQQAAIISMLSLLGSSVAALLVSHFFFKKGANREG